MPPHPITPTYRITFPITVNAFTHVFHAFCDVVTSADPSGFNTVARAPLTNAGVSGCMTKFWNNIHALYDPATAAFGNAHLDHFSSGSWIPVWYEANAVAPVGTGGNLPAQQMVFSGYDTAHEKMKFILMETVDGYVERRVSYSTMNSAEQSAADAFFNLNAGAINTSLYAWAKSRDDNYIGAFISLVNSGNKHWRRKRGLG